jgi:hypothetical protein
MKKPLLFILLFLVVIVGILLAYFVFTPKVQSDIPVELPPQTLLSGEITGDEQTFEEAFYQDLSDLFDGEPNGYEEIQGEYGFRAE